MKDSFQEGSIKQASVDLVEVLGQPLKKIPAVQLIFQWFGHNDFVRYAVCGTPVYQFVKALLKISSTN